MKTKRTFSTEEKLSILREGSENGVQPTLEKHGIYPATFTVGVRSLMKWERTDFLTV